MLLDEPYEYCTLNFDRGISYISCELLAMSVLVIKKENMLKKTQTCQEWLNNFNISQAVETVLVVPGVAQARPVAVASLHSSSSSNSNNSSGTTRARPSAVGWTTVAPASGAKTFAAALLEVILLSLFTLKGYHCH